MPIYDIINEDNTVTNICKFGVGDIAVFAATYGEITHINSLTFTEAKETHEIGSKVGLEKYENSNSDVVLSFDNLESIEVVIRGLNKIKRAFESAAK
jgi:hypothetical protein